jgi:hypothetical protein
MLSIDIKAETRYQPLNEKSAAELFDLGVLMARVLKVRVRAPTGDLPDEAVTLDGRLLSRKGVEIY